MSESICLIGFLSLNCLCYYYTNTKGNSFATFVHPDDNTRLNEYLNRVLTTGQSETSSAYRIRHADGSWLWFVVNGTLYVNTKGERQFIGVARDITELKNLEKEKECTMQELMQLSDSLAAANRKLDYLSGTTRAR